MVLSLPTDTYRMPALAPCHPQSNTLVMAENRCKIAMLVIALSWVPLRVSMSYAASTLNAGSTCRFEVASASPLKRIAAMLTQRCIAHLFFFFVTIYSLASCRNCRAHQLSLLKFAADLLNREHTSLIMDKLKNMASNFKDSETG